MTETTKYCQEGNLYVEGVVKGRVTLGLAQSVVATGDLVLAGGLNGADMLGLVATNSVEVFHPWMMKVGPDERAARARRPASGPTPATGPVTVVGLARPVHGPDRGDDRAPGVQIMGSIQTLQHSFYVQQYNEGARRRHCSRSTGRSPSAGAASSVPATGRRATSRTTSTTRRLKYAAPPYFPRWVNAQWSQRYFGEIRTRRRGDVAAT